MSEAIITRKGSVLPKLSNPGTASDMLSGKELIDQNNNIITGTIPTKSVNDLTTSGATVTIPAGYYASQATKSVATATQATPSITVDSAGKITASATQTAGYVAAGIKSATKQLTVQAAKTITPSSSAQTAVASGRYTTGAVTVSGDADLKASNIKKGVNIFNIAGSYEGVELNYKVVGGTTQPSNPTENTIWVNTSTTITSHIFSSTKPTGIDGMVWISTDISSFVDFNILKDNVIQIYPKFVKQYINNAWVNKTAKSYQNGTWIDWWDGVTLYDSGNQAEIITGGWELNPNMNFSGAINNGVITFNNDSFRIQCPTGGAAIASTKNKINISGYTAIHFDVLITKEANNSCYGIISNHGDVWNNYVAGRPNDTSAGSRVTLPIDISGVLDGEYYVFVSTANDRIRDIYSIKLVR